MGANSEIAWTHHTFNAWWGCQRVSPGCEHCYAESFSKRVGLKVWGPTTERRFFGDKHWAEPLKWNRAAEKAGERHRVFCASMADVFEDREDLLVPRARLATLIAQTPHLDWLLLTKRPENADGMWLNAQIDAFNGADSLGPVWLPNIWLGTTAEDRKRADERIPHLLATPAAVRFVSYEPAIEAVDFSRWMWPTHWSWDAKYKTPEEAIAAGARAEKSRQALVLAPTRFLDWIIVGGESGPGARPFDLAWARSVVAQCKAAKVACFVKQLGARPFAGLSELRRPVGFHATGDRLGLGLRHRKGGDMEEWPEDLRVREFPEVRP